MVRTPKGRNVIQKRVITGFKPVRLTGVIAFGKEVGRAIKEKRIPLERQNKTRKTLKN